MEYERILVATDGSEHANSAARHAVDLARRHDATLYAIAVLETEGENVADVVDDDTLTEGLSERAESALDAVAELAADSGVDVERLRCEGDPPEEILTAAEDHDTDVIVVGRRGRSESIYVMLGSTTDVVLQHSEVPVVVCP